MAISFARGDRSEAVLDVQQLRFFIAAAECGNMLSAAHQCNISQSGLSRSIAHLEQRLGVQLLIRRSRGVELSIYGQKFLKRARLILNEVNNSFAELRSMDWSGMSELVVGVTQNYGHYLIPDIVLDLIQAAPDSRLVVKTGGYFDLLTDLREGALDLVFGLIGPVGEQTDICVELLREHHSRVIARRSHPLAMLRREVTPAELSAARWATLSSEGFQLNFAHYFISQKLNRPVQAVMTDSIPLIRRLVSLNDFLTVLPPGAVNMELDNGDLVILDCDAPGEETDVGLITRRASITTPQQQHLTNLIRSRFYQAAG
jgi:DNA-binding transcriptional LysR family regulator